MERHRPDLGDRVHYVSNVGDGNTECRAAFITEIDRRRVGLLVITPTGFFFPRNVEQDEHDQEAGTWHWPKRA